MKPLKVVYLVMILLLMACAIFRECGEGIGTTSGLANKGYFIVGNIFVAELGKEIFMRNHDKDHLKDTLRTSNGLIGFRLANDYTEIHEVPEIDNEINENIINIFKKTFK